MGGSRPKPAFAFALIPLLVGAPGLPRARGAVPEPPEPPAPPPPGAELPALDLLGDARFLFFTGFVSARENEVEGDRFYFRDLNADFGQQVGLSGRLNLTSRDRLELRGAWLNLRGSTSYDTARVFNETEFAAGTTIETKPDWLELRGSYLRRLFELPAARSSLWFLFGIDYHYINWKFEGTLTPRLGNEPSEDFYRQTFPLPVFGLRWLLDLGPEWSFDLRGDGFRANHWRHWEDEGGPIYTSSTIADVSGTFRWQPKKRFFIEAGYLFSYYTLDEDGPEDGNHLLTRQHGPVLGLGLSW